MNLRDAFFTTVLSAWLVNWACNSSNNETFATNEYDSIPWATIRYPDDVETLSKYAIFDDTKDNTVKEISVCLVQDENSHTHTGVLKSIKDPENTILEFPVSQLFEKYWNRPHPLAVRWIKKDFRSLLWKDWIENRSSEIPQKLSARSENVTSDTQYEIWDTIRFSLIEPSLRSAFPKYLSEQLNEDWFTSFSDLDSSAIIEKKKNENLNINLDIDNKSPEDQKFVYDIVVKSLPTWEAALALYRDWELFMATYASVWLNSRKTKTWQFKIIGSNPYYYSRKYKSPMPDWLNFDEWWFWFHQWNVTRHPASHGCVRLPGLYAAAMYSLVKWNPDTDVFISNNLYNRNK